jgi:hypothetical protein
MRSEGPVRRTRRLDAPLWGRSFSHLTARWEGRQLTQRTPETGLWAHLSEPLRMRPVQLHLEVPQGANRGQDRPKSARIEAGWGATRRGHLQHPYGFGRPRRHRFTRERSLVQAQPCPYRFAGISCLFASLLAPGSPCVAQHGRPWPGLLACNPCWTAVSRVFAGGTTVLSIDSLPSATRRCPCRSRMGRAWGWTWDGRRDRGVSAFPRSWPDGARFKDR